MMHGVGSFNLFVLWPEKKVWIQVCACGCLVGRPRTMGCGGADGVLFFFSERICGCIAAPFLPFLPIPQRETWPSPENVVWSLIWICEDPPVVGEQTEGVSFTFISYHSCFAHLCFKGLRNLRWWGHAIIHFCAYHWWKSRWCPWWQLRHGSQRVLDVCRLLSKGGQLFFLF